MVTISAEYQGFLERFQRQVGEVTARFERTVAELERKKTQHRVPGALIAPGPHAATPPAVGIRNPQGRAPAARRGPILGVTRSPLGPREG